MNTKLLLHAALSILILTLAGCSDDLTSAEYAGSSLTSSNLSPSPSALSPSPAKVIPDLSGDWNWTESQQIVVTAELEGLWGLTDYPDDPIRITCTSGGRLELVQTGATFTGSGSQQSTCETPDGASTPTVPFPQGENALGIEGYITGRAVHFEALVGEGFYCPYKGSLKVGGGVATEMRASGRCETPFDAQPLTGSAISFNAVR